MTYDCQVMKPPVGCKHLPVKLACNKIISSKYIQNEIVFFFSSLITDYQLKDICLVIKVLQFLENIIFVVL